MFLISTKQKINGESSTEIEITGVDDVMPQALWTNHFMKAQGWSHNTKIHQDNNSAIPLENNGRLSRGNRTKHTNVRCHFIKDAIDRGKATVEHLSTDKMWTDHFTKPLQGKKFVEFRKNIVNS